MSDARARMRFDSSAVSSYQQKQAEEKRRKQEAYEQGLMAKLRPKQLVIATSIAAQIAGYEYNYFKGVRNGKN